MSAKASILKSLIAELSDSVATGAGLNLIRSARDLVTSGRADDAAALLLRAGSSGVFGGNLDDVEKTALRRLFTTGGLGVKPMAVKDAKSIQQVAALSPLILNNKNFPSRMRELGFVPLTGQNINNPGLTLAQFTGKTKNRFIDEGARNLQAAIDLDPTAAAEYAKFYPKVQQQLLETGVPVERVGGAWATLSAAADPETNAELLTRIMRNPEQATTSQLNQMDALRFLSGQVDDASDVLGQGKRFNFMMNSISPDDPRFLTADTRYAQNLQGIKNTYATAPFSGLFQPRGRRYGEIYVEPGLEAARRSGMNPNAVQAASWGNWRNQLFGIPMDVRGDLLGDLSGFDYNPDAYSTALSRISQMSPDTWQASLKQLGNA
tara:strand:+ start:49 stop:1182 length:1134 start_codon:yes stop_codon:yes gene_type:complete